MSDHYGSDIMQIRDPLHGNIQIPKSIKALIHSRPFSRLRFIRQLGFAEFSYPGATHNRFVHSLGVFHLAQMCFDRIFEDYKFENPKKREHFKNAVAVAGLTHDLGHGPLSHTSEIVMPALQELNLEKVLAYDSRKNQIDLKSQADHEDYTLKFLADSDLTQEIEREFPDLSPLFVACLINKTLEPPGAKEFFTDGSIDFRPVLSQIISSEVDADRLDYLSRDAHYCGTNYGKIESTWLIQNMTFHVKDDKAYLALDRKALYAFDNLLFSRYHMFLMVYFHQKNVIYDHMLKSYLKSEDCTLTIPGDINKYIACTDTSVYADMAQSSNFWAQRISTQTPYRLLFEEHLNEKGGRAPEIERFLEQEGLDSILINSSKKITGLGGSGNGDRSVYLCDEFSTSDPFPIKDISEFISSYTASRSIQRIYVAPEKLETAQKQLKKAGHIVGKQTR